MPAVSPSTDPAPVSPPLSPQTLDGGGPDPAAGGLQAGNYWGGLQFGSPYNPAGSFGGFGQPGGLGLGNPGAIGGNPGGGQLPPAPAAEDGAAGEGAVPKPGAIDIGGTVPLLPVPAVPEPTRNLIYPAPRGFEGAAPKFGGNGAQAGFLPGGFGAQSGFGGGFGAQPGFGSFAAQSGGFGGPGGGFGAPGGGFGGPQGYGGQGGLYGGPGGYGYQSPGPYGGVPG